MKTVMIIMCLLNFLGMCATAFGAIFYAWTGNITAGLVQALACTFFGCVSVFCAWLAK